MKRAWRWAAAVAAALAVALVPLLLLDGDRRALGFRVYAALLGVGAARAIIAFTAESDGPPPDSPFRRRRRLPAGLPRPRAAGRREVAGARRPVDHLVLSALEHRGPFHFRLRPVLRDAADERLRAHHGVTIDDPAAAARLGPVAWELLRPDLAPPHDRRAPGPSAETLAEVLAAVEAL